MVLNTKLVLLPMIWGYPHFRNTSIFYILLSKSSISRRDFPEIKHPFLGYPHLWKSLWGFPEQIGLCPLSQNFSLQRQSHRLSTLGLSLFGKNNDPHGKVSSHIHSISKFWLKITTIWHWTCQWYQWCFNLLQLKTTAAIINLKTKTKERRMDQWVNADGVVKLHGMNDVRSLWKRIDDPSPIFNRGTVYHPTLSNSSLLGFVHEYPIESSF